jgi:hypothetical protein
MCNVLFFVELFILLLDYTLLLDGCAIQPSADLM